MINELKKTMPGQEIGPDLAPLLEKADIRTVNLAARRVGMMRDTRYVKDIVRVIARSDQTVEEEKDVAIECKEYS